MKVFPADLCRAAFERYSVLRRYFVGPMLARNDALAHIGLDAASCEVWKYPRLLEKLQSHNEDNHDGGRFELEVFAALRRATSLYGFAGAAPLRPEPRRRRRK